jgi:hypothetical protein
MPAPASCRTSSGNRCAQCSTTINSLPAHNPAPQLCAVRMTEYV